MLFVAMCRVSGIPARWQSGWRTKPHDDDMHDWAEFYVAPWGWLPADPTYGGELKDHPDPVIRDFYLGHQDFYRLSSTANTVRRWCRRSIRCGRSRWIFSVGRWRSMGANLYFRQWDYEMNVER
jgi:hypothetical protein